MEFTILQDLIVILALAILILFFCARTGGPAIVGFLLTGVLAGPTVLGLIEEKEKVEVLAELGVVLLLFTIGVEFSISSLSRIKRLVILGGTLQVTLTIVVSALLARLAGFPTNQAIFIGFVLSMSSTAIVLKILQEKALVESPQGRTAIGILLFQDLVIVVLVLLTPALAKEGGVAGGQVLWILAKSVIVLVLVFVLARIIVPRLFYQIVRTRNRELFMLSLVVFCLGLPWATLHLGLSLGLGAFLAGIIIAETEYSEQALSSMLPFRDVFSSIFFISIGMLLDIHVMLSDWWMIGVVTLGVFALKAMTGGLSVLLLGLPTRIAVATGLLVSQVGEFAFVLLALGARHELLQEVEHQRLIAVTILTMALTPLVVRMAPTLAHRALRIEWLRRLDRRREGPDDETRPKLSDHLVIVGFGVTGRNLAKAARGCNIPYIIVEMNPQTVRNEKQRGEPIVFGDATQRTVIEHTGLSRARALAVAVPDPSEVRRITRIAHQLNPSINIIARTRYATEIEALHKLGADQIVAEEYEASIEITRRVLDCFMAPRDVVETICATVRADDYGPLGEEGPQSSEIERIAGSGSKISVTTAPVMPGSPLAGRTLASLDLRRAHGVTLLAIHRHGEAIPNPPAEAIIQAEDILVVFGEPEKIAVFARASRRPVGSTPAAG